jgi:predicted aldo/keto reductase-like oxidoreductase
MFSQSRREFLKTAAAALAAAQVGSTVLADQKENPAGLPTRPLGKTGERVSIIGLGGWNIGTAEEKDAIAIMHEAIDNGITFFDNSWDYHNGRSEEVMGKALASGNYRNKVFLMTKVCARDEQRAREHLADSLRRLQTDHLDLWQFHGIQWKDDPDLIFAEHGALKAALDAKKAGKVRHIGFTGHKSPAFHLAMLEKPFAWDSVQMPLNILDTHYASFQKQVLPVLNKREIAAIGMKALGGVGGRIPRELNLPAELCRGSTLSLPISVLVCGIDSRKDLLQDLAIARNFKPLTAADIADVESKTKQPAADGHIEAYKVGNYGCDWHHQHAAKGS